LNLRYSLSQSPEGSHLVVVPHADLHNPLFHVVLDPGPQELVAEVVGGDRLLDDFVEDVAMGEFYF
jgi:hypothetical protein